MTVTAVDERLLTPERLAEMRAAIELAISGEWDVLDALDLQFSTAIALIDALEAARKEIAGLREGLVKIEAWKMPETDQFWDKERTSRMSYSALHGSNGERDFIRAIARNLLAGGNSNE